MLGDTYNNNKNNQDRKPVGFSEYTFANSEGIDPSRLVPSFWNNMLKLTISPKKNTGTEEIAYDYENSLSIYLTHTKARLLYNEICEFQANPKKYTNVGVNTGIGLISLSNGKEFGIDTPCLVFRKIDAETGNVESSYAYQFKTDYHFTIRNYDQKENSFDRFYYDSIELEQFKSLLLSYYEAMTGSIGYSVMNQSYYGLSKQNEKLDAIADKLGIEFNTGYSNTKKSSNSYFNNSNGSTSSSRSFDQSTIDDIASQLG